MNKIQTEKGSVQKQQCQQFYHANEENERSMQMLSKLMRRLRKASSQALLLYKTGNLPQVWAQSK